MSEITIKTYLEKMIEVLQTLIDNYGGIEHHGGYPKEGYMYVKGLLEKELGYLHTKQHYNVITIEREHYDMLRLRIKELEQYSKDLLEHVTKIQALKTVRVIIPKQYVDDYNGLEKVISKGEKV
jgi:hypothetical protein